MTTNAFGGLLGSSTTRALTSDVAQVLSHSTKSIPIWSPRTPRWTLRCFDACQASLPVEGGMLQINRVNDGAFAKGSDSPYPPSLRSKSLAANVSRDLSVVDTSVALYDTEPQRISLESIQSIVRLATRVPTLYSQTYDQLQWQFQLTAEYMYETKEDLIFNHSEYGLLQNVDPDMELGDVRPIGPHVLDDLLSLGWKRPDCFAMHPRALAAFHRAADDLSLTLESIELFGACFTTWRGLPIIPTDKLGLYPSRVESAAAARASMVAGATVGLATPSLDWLPAKGSAHEAGTGHLAVRASAESEQTTDVLLMRCGADNQGVVSLHAADAESHPALPYINVELMGRSDEAVASYLMSTYSAVAVLSPGALAHARVRIGS